MRWNASLTDFMKNAMPGFGSAIVAGLACLLAADETAHAVPRLVAGVVRGFPGRTVEVPVSLRYRTNDVRDVVALQADVIFDATGVTDGEPAPGGMLNNHVQASSRPASGTRRLLVYSPANAVLTNGEVARIPFTIGPNEYRNFSLRLTNVILVRADASQVFGTTADGAIAVNQVYLAPNGQADGFLNVSSNGVEQCYVIQATTDFQSWVNIQTNSTESGLLEFADPAAGAHPHRFYRALLCDSISGERIGVIEQLPNGQIHFDFTGTAGRTYVLQASTNLAQWKDLSTSAAPIGFTTGVDPAVPYRFFRLKEAP